MDYLNNLIEVQKMFEESEGDSDSELCRNCSCTEYGEYNNSGQTNGGYYSCEGSRCNETMENIEEDLIYKYNKTKEEIGLKDVKMKLEVDLGILEQNLVKMVTDNIEEKVVSNLMAKIENKVSKLIEDKLEQEIKSKIDLITEQDIYNIYVNIDGVKVNLFNHMVKNLIEKANTKSVEFDKSIEEVKSKIVYDKIDTDYNENEYKVLTTYSEGEYGSTKSIEISVNGHGRIHLYESEPEDMTFNRDLNDALRIPELIKEAYIAGRAGKIMYEAEEVIKD